MKKKWRYFMEGMENSNRKKEKAAAVLNSVK